MLSIIITSFWNYTVSIIKEAVLELCALELSSFLEFGWRVANMKLNVRSVAATAAVLAATSQAQCPDYTSYSQVCRPNGRLTDGQVTLLRDRRAHMRRSQMDHWLCRL